MYYVIRVRGGKEEETIASIKRHLGENSEHEFFSPFRKTLRKYKDGYKEVTERCFPGYIFVDTDDPEAVFFALYWVEEYTRMLGKNGLSYLFDPLTEEETRMVDILYSRNTDRVTPISDIEVREGQEIFVLDGPLMGMTARIKKVNLHKRYVTIDMPFAGAFHEVKLGINIITPVPK